MKKISTRELSILTGISVRTLNDLARREPHLVENRGKKGNYFILDELAKKPGLNIVALLTLTDGGRWVKVVDLAKLSGIPRRTLANWAKTRENFGIRIGRTWYLNTNALSPSPEQRLFLDRWAQNAKNDEEKQD